ncbi:sulfite oxidase-like [Hydractinia symbiolongicarpus]|uniref:sulfite oxidase-like n=1 Tax=Hydractinia symbiolongicarpus TaxID=13093 RepID=UPI0025502F5D|nr:sulfite oxidase-like [Hydractinia symbiolongicarpus]
MLPRLIGKKYPNISAIYQCVNPARNRFEKYVSASLVNLSENQTKAYLHVEQNYQQHKQDQKKRRTYFLPFLLTTAVSLSGLKYYLDHRATTSCSKKVPQKLFSRQEVAKKNSKETGVWVIFGHDVYDITEFVANHPGGANYIMLAAGKNVEPYWEMYAFHKNGEVLDILKEYHIGELRKEDWVVEESSKAGPFANDPKRHPALIANSTEPFNAETPPILAVDKLITPNDLFFVRNHLPVPNLRSKDHKLIVKGLGIKKTIVLTVDELKSKYKKVTLEAALQCAGNRRSEMNPIKKVKGLSWSHNAISNAVWGGVLLKDVLIRAGVEPEDKNLKHIHFEGADTDPTGAPYGASIPANRVFNKNTPILIAYEMNGEPLPRDHGFPLRILAPGIVGARNVKWLQKIVVSDKEYPGHWQQNDYKPFSPNIDWDNVDFSKSRAIQELPVTSAICSPPEGSVVNECDEEVTVKGYAYSGGGNAIVRVDVTTDGGKTWHTAKINQTDQDIYDTFSWALWECILPIPPNHNGKMEILCRAVDSSCNTQPETVAPIWNLRGVLNNAWHKMTLKVENDDDE